MNTNADAAESPPPQIANVAFANRYLNAAGCWCTTAAELADLHASPAGGVVSKSCTEAARAGNAEPRLRLAPHLSINSTGLANAGVRFYGEFGRSLRLNRPRKPYVVSAAGVEPGEHLRVVRTLCEEYADAVDLIELNLSCPNVAGKPQVGYDFEATREALRRVFEARDPAAPPVGVKLPPYFDASHFKGIAEVLGEYAGRGGAGGQGRGGHGLAFATCINSLGNGLVYDRVDDRVAAADDRVAAAADNTTSHGPSYSYAPAIAPNRGFGGVGGAVVKPFGLANVAALHAELPALPLIGCGGIASKGDADEYAHAGATLVQVGTALLRETPQTVFARLLSGNDTS
jgi:dihydroorotate dehydrogenase (fumarate)